MVDFENFLKLPAVNDFKRVARNCSNFYKDTKEDIEYRRKETVAEHVASGLRLAHFFMSTEPEFKDLDRVLVYETFMYHDDPESITQDLCISNREGRKNKEQNEKAAAIQLATRYPRGLDEKMLDVHEKWNSSKEPYMLFCHGVDKMDALVQELPYPQDWGPKGFSENNVRKWFQPSFEYSPTFMNYFERLMQHLKENKYF